MPEIHVRGLVKEFGDQRALDDVSFTVADGELFTLLGPSGCGKSTTLMSIAGFQTPEQGSIEVGSERFFDAAANVAVPAERRNLGIVFQSYAVWPHMTVYENLAFPLKVRKLKRAAIRERVRDVLELVEMTPFEQRYPHQLSGGQQQRVALARALVYAPTPAPARRAVLQPRREAARARAAWVKELQHRLGLTTIFVTHDQDEALSMSDRVAVMSAGEVQQIGTPEEVYRRPFNRFVAEFVGRVNLIEGVISRGVVDVEGGTHKLRVIGADGADGAVTVAVRPEAVSVIRPDDMSVNGTNTWEARVETVAFLGDHYEYEVQAGPLALTVQRPRRVDGDRIKLHIPPDMCAVVG